MQSVELASSNRLATADALRELARLLEATGQPMFRVRAYERAARVVEQLPEDDLFARIEEGRLQELPFIGPSLASKIEQLWRTGSLAELDQLRQQVPSGFREMSRIEGLGPKRILQLHRELGIDTLDDLQRAIEQHEVQKLKGFSAQGEEKLGQALARVRDRQHHYLWLDATREASRLLPRVEAAGASEAQVAGEARRAQEELDVLTVVATADPPEPAAQALQQSLFGAVLQSPTRLLARGVDGLPVEVRFTSREGRAAAMVWETGPRQHVELLVARAASRGMSLTPEALLGADGTPIALASEPELYETLGLPYVPPELREDPYALREADGFEDLLQVEDLVGATHCHTTFSDGRHTVEEMARAADAMGFAYLTITDHSPSASYAGGVQTDALRRQWDEIDRVQELVDVVLLKGTESDILADGALDYPDPVLEQLDVVIASIHMRHRLDRRGMTERLVRAMAHPVFKIWGHGLGRLVGRREPIDCDVEQVLDTIAQSRAAIEINSDPHRLDLPPEWVRRARVRGIPFVVSSDAHSVGGLTVLPFGVGIARRAGVRKHEVLNTLPVERFRALVRPAP
jgi:DNA polymerase (family 10)